MNGDDKTKKSDKQYKENTRLNSETFFILSKIFVATSKLNSEW